MHLKVFVNYCTLVTFRAVVTDVGIFFFQVLCCEAFLVFEKCSLLYD